MIVKDANDFLRPGRAQWYASRGIPYRRGYLFSGPPGTGKSSVSYALAGLFGLDIFIASLNKAGLTDDDLSNLLINLPSKCIVLLEDVDCTGMDRKDTQEDEYAQFQQNQRSKTASLSGLLNAIDGVTAHEGHILIMTTNHPETLDDALKRPGRVDLHIEFGLATQTEIREIFIRMYSNEPRTTQPPTKASTTTTAATQKQTPTIHSVCRESSSLLAHRHSPFMPPQELQSAATTFASHFPSHPDPPAFSPAEVQGYLLKHKTHPLDAIAQVPAWISSQQRARAQDAQEALLRAQRAAANAAKVKEAAEKARVERADKVALRAFAAAKMRSAVGGPAASDGGAGVGDVGAAHAAHTAGDAGGTAQTAQTAQTVGNAAAGDVGDIAHAAGDAGEAAAAVGGAEG